MKKIILLHFVLVVVILSCSNGIKSTVNDESFNSDKTLQTDYKQLFCVNLAHPYNKDSIIVWQDVSNRKIIIVHVNSSKEKDTIFLNEATNVIHYELLKDGSFGIEVGIRCGSDCELHEYHLFRPIEGKLNTILAIKSYQYHSMDKMFNQKIDSTYKIHERSEYVAKVINISQNDHQLWLCEKQNEEYNYYEQIPANYFKEYTLGWDSLNNVYCNSYVDLNGIYKCVSDLDFSTTTKSISAMQIPSITTMKFTYVFYEGKWAILDKNNNTLSFLMQ